MPNKSYALHMARATESTWQSYRQKREQYDELVNRFFTPVIDPRFVYAQEGGADYRTPALIKAEGDIGDVLTMNPTRLDGIANGETRRARDQADFLRLYCAAVWNRVNRGRWWDRAVGVDQWRRGLKVTRKYFRDSEEPGFGSLEAREEWMRDHSDIWGIEDIETLAVRWYPVSTPPKVIVYEYEMPLLDAMQEFAVDGAYIEGLEEGTEYAPAFDEARPSKLGWMVRAGDDFPTGAANQAGDHTVTVVVCEYEDRRRTCPVCADEHYMWSAVEVIRGPGAAAKDGEVVAEYALPWRGSSFMITKGRTGNERDPDLRHKPFGLPAFVEASNINWASSVLMLLASRDSADERVWIEINNNLPDNWQWPEGFAENGYQVDRPDWDGDKIPAYPGKLQAWPTTLAPALIEYMNRAEQRLQEALPNRFALGQAYDEAKGPATNFSLSLQSSRLPFGFLHSQSDSTIKDDFFEDGVLHAIRYWAYGLPEKEQRRYYERLYSDLNDSLVRGGAKDGEEVYLSAERLATGPKLALTTQDETLQEQMQRRQMAILGKQQRAISSRQFLEEWGHLDIEAQMQLLDEEDARAQAREVGAEVQRRIIAVLIAELADIDPTWMGTVLGPPGGEPSQMPGGAPGPSQVPGLGVPNVRLPALQAGDRGPNPIGGGP